MPRVIIGEDPTPRPGVVIPSLTQVIGLPTAPVISSQPTAGHGVTLSATGTLPTNVAATALQVLTSDPQSPVVGQMWYRSDLSKLCIRHDATTTKTVTLA